MNPIANMGIIAGRMGGQAMEKDTIAAAAAIMVEAIGICSAQTTPICISRYPNNKQLEWQAL
jgi:hypothetical protein